MVLPGNQTVKMEDSFLGMWHDDQYLGYSEYIIAPKFTFKLNLQVQILLNLYIHAIDIGWLTNILLFFSALQLTNLKFVSPVRPGSNWIHFLFPLRFLASGVLSYFHIPSMSSAIGGFMSGRDWVAHIFRQRPESTAKCTKIFSTEHML